MKSKSFLTLNINGFEKWQVLWDKVWREKHDHHEVKKHHEICFSGIRGLWMQRRGRILSHSADWRPVWASVCCCSLFRMMLMMSPSCSFMCSMRRSLFTDSKPQIQQQNKSTQYSMPGPRMGHWLWDWAGYFPCGLEFSAGTLGSAWFVIGVSTLPKLVRPAAAADVTATAVGSSAEAIALSFESWATGWRSATASITADSFCGALVEIKHGVTYRNNKGEQWQLDSHTFSSVVPFPERNYSVKSFCMMTVIFTLSSKRHLPLRNYEHFKQSFFRGTTD